MCFCLDCILSQQSSFRSAQCQIVYKFVEILCKGSRSQSRLHCRPRYLGRSLKKFFAERKREEKNANVHSLPRFARYNDARVNAFVRPLLRLRLDSYRVKESFVHEQSLKKNPNS